MQTIKYSRQREALLDNLAHRYDHPTADMLYESIRPAYPHISLGTVYRNLNLLSEQGRLTKLSCGDGTVHYDYNTSPHYHFYCKDCGRMIDISMPYLEDIDSMVEPEIGKADSHSLIFYGCCKNCSDKKSLE